MPSSVNLLIKGMIEKDPKKRITIDEIGQNIWLKNSNNNSKNTNINTNTNKTSRTITT